MKNLGFNMQHTLHASTRGQQRGIPQEVVNFIVKHGHSINTHTHKKSFISKKVFNKLMFNRDHIHFLKKHDKQIKSTAVIWDKHNQKIITAFKITKRVNWIN